MIGEDGIATEIGRASTGAEGSTKVALGTYYNLIEGWWSIWISCTDSVDRGLLLKAAPAKLIWSLFRAKPASVMVVCLLIGSCEDVTLPEANARGDGETTSSVCTSQ